MTSVREDASRKIEKNDTRSAARTLRTARQTIPRIAALSMRDPLAVDRAFRPGIK